MRPFTYLIGFRVTIYLGKGARHSQLGIFFTDNSPDAGTCWL